jgi:5-methylcytosine-specific restriction endonuclease McrA
MYQWGAVSPRTCEHCGIDKTVWWALTAGKRTVDDLTPEQRKTVARILNELSD